MKTALFLLTAACASAQLSLPRLGYVRDGGGEIRSVTGLAGNFIVGAATMTSVISAAFSSSGGFVKTDSSIVVVDSTNRIVSTKDAPGGPAFFSLLAGPSALIYIPSSQSLYRWSSGNLDPLPFDATQLGGKALSLAAIDSASAEFAVQRSDGLWLLQFTLSTGGLRSAEPIPGVGGPALLLAGGSPLYSDKGEIVLRLASHAEARYPLGAAVDSMEQMADGWVHVRARNRLEFALRLPAGRDEGRLYVLPSPPAIGQ